jgi:hypothetical protein
MEGVRAGDCRNAGTRVIPLFHRRFRVSYSIQIPKTIRLKLKNAGRFQALRGLAGVFSISGSHLVRLVPQFESGQNCSDGLHRLGAAVKRGP